MLNHIAIHGRLTRDPSLRQTQSGVSVCNFCVAVDRPYTKSGEDKQTDFIDCVAWRGAADAIAKYFTKGKEIVVGGSLQSRKWVDNDGNNRTSWEVQVENFDFCGSKGESGGGQSQGYSSPGYSAPTEQSQGFAEMLDDDGDLPF